MKKSKSLLGLLLALLLLVGLTPTCAFAADSDEPPPLYGSLSIYGDSLCLGFQAAEALNAMDPQAFDITENACQNKYPHSYPSVLAELLGLSPIDDLRNYGICAAWTADMYQLMSDPDYIYPYDSTNYDESTTFVLPKDYDGYRLKVTNTDAPDYDVGNPATWVYGSEQEWEPYHIDAGTAIHVAYTMEFWGIQFLSLNSIISEKYYYVSEKCLDACNRFIDPASVIYYPTVQDPDTWSYAPDESEANMETLGHAKLNPMFTKFYYSEINNSMASSDLLLLAIGGNDIYHSMIDQNQFLSSNTSPIGQIIYWLNQGLMLNGSSITDLLNNEQYRDLIADLLESLGNIPSDEPISLDHISPEMLVEETPAVNSLSAEAVADLLRFYSRDNISAYMADMIANYKVEYEKCVQYMLSNKKCDTPLVLVGNYNPYGFLNYAEMLAGALENGELAAHLQADGAALLRILQAVMGTKDVYETLQNMSENELAQAVQDVQGELDSILNHLAALRTADLSDEEVDRLFRDLSFPMTVLIMGSGLSGVYEEMNTFLADLAEKYAAQGAVYVDISNAPSNNRYDPHPDANGHQWIARKLYRAIAPTIEASILPCGSGSGSISEAGVQEASLLSSRTYVFQPDNGSRLSAVFVDNHRIDPQTKPEVYENGTYTFTDIRENHTICVQFDKSCDLPGLSVSVLNSYSPDSGAGFGKHPGEVVCVDAGAHSGLAFAGWVNLGPAAANLNDASAAQTSFVMPNGCVTLLATWKPAPLTVTFETNGGSPIDPLEISPCSDPINLADFTTVKEHYTFDGWYLDSAYTQPVETLQVTESTTVYAKWHPDTYTLTFQTNGGNELAPLTGTVESSAVDLSAVLPIRQGYVFAGWYLDVALAQAVSSVVLDHDMTVYAKWSQAVPPTPGGQTVDTGDHDSMGQWMVIASVSLLLLAAAAFWRRKNHLI